MLHAGESASLTEFHHESQPEAGAPERDRWGSRAAFLCAAIGSAIGLGNIWRFPYQVYSNGGGAFLIPYVLALTLVGFPVLFLELALGQQMQRGAMLALGGVSKRLWGLGFACAFSSFIVVSYYNLLMAWSWIYFFSSFSKKLPWGSDQAGAEKYFFHNTLGMWHGDLDENGNYSSSADLNSMGDIQYKPALALLLNWIVVYLCIWKGPAVTGKVAMVTMPLPFLLLFVFLFRGISLPGSATGLEFLFHPDLTKLENPRIWLQAVSQIFFTLSLAGGIMIAYGSYSDKKSNVMADTMTIAFSNFSCEMLAGLAVFSILGYMAHEKETSVENVVDSGISLVFIVFPQVLSLMPAPQFFSVLFFLMLLSLGIDSAFSLVEAFTTIIYDRFPNLSSQKEKVSFVVCLVGFFSGLMMTTRAGLHFLDILDHYLSDYVLMIVGLFECISVGWIYPADRLAKEVEENTGKKVPRVWVYIIKFVDPLLIFLLIVLNFHEETKHRYGDYPVWAIVLGWLVVVFALVMMVVGTIFPMSDHVMRHHAAVERDARGGVQEMHPLHTQGLINAAD